MADSIKIGNSSITLKLGSSDVTAAYIGSILVYSGGTPPTPTFQGKWLATYSDSSTSSADCDSSSAITIDEITLTDLVSIEISDCVTSIGSRAFQDCSSLTTVTIGSGVTLIDYFAFYGCYSLTSIDMPNSVTSIGSGAFYNCSGLTSIDIPDSVTNIDMGAFDSCGSLTSITVEATTPPTLGSNAFANTNDCPIYVPCQSLEAYKTAWSTYESRIQCLTPPTPTFQGKWLATYLDSSTSSAECDASSAITKYEIYGVDGLVSVEIGDCVTSIGDGVFTNCYSLSSATIPDSVTSIGNSAFRSCSSLTSVTVNATTPPTLGFIVFDGSTCPIYVPAASLTAYQSATNWSDYASRIQAIPNS